MEREGNFTEENTGGPGNGGFGFVLEIIEIILGLSKFVGVIQVE